MTAFCSAEEVRTMALFLLTKERLEGKRFNVSAWELSKLKDDHAIRAPHCTLDWLWRNGCLSMRENESGGYTVIALDHGEIDDLVALEV